MSDNLAIEIARHRQTQEKLDIAESKLVSVHRQLKNALSHIQLQEERAEAKLAETIKWIQKAAHHNYCMRLDCYDERDHGCTCGKEAILKGDKP